MELVSFEKMPKELKIRILDRLGYGVSGDFVVYKDQKRVKDKYIGIDVSVNNVLVFPGSTIVMDNNPLSIAAYLDEHNDKEL